MLDARTTALLDQEDSLVSTHIREHGWHITAVNLIACARPSEVSVPVLQLTYDDKAGRFPWDVGYANAPELQPRPGTFQA